MNREPSKEYTLSLLRTVSARLKLIDQEVIAIGVALANGLISASKARAMSEEVAPGCIDAVALALIMEAGGE
jgi:hypothetical protein